MGAQRRPACPKSLPRKRQSVPRGACDPVIGWSGFIPILEPWPTVAALPVLDGGDDMDAGAIRSAFLDYFRQRQHAQLAPAGLVLVGDTSTLFTGSGMQPLLPYLLGAPHPAGRRLVNSQPCLRAQDI